MEVVIDPAAHTGDVGNTIPTSIKITAAIILRNFLYFIVSLFSPAARALGNIR
jgi:hypothetical protein